MYRMFVSNNVMTNCIVMAFEFPWVYSLSRFKLSLPQCSPGVSNCISGRLSGFPIPCIDGMCVLAMQIITILTKPKGHYEFKHTPEILGEVYAPLRHNLFIFIVLH